MASSNPLGNVHSSLVPVTIGASAKEQLPMGIGGSWFVPFLTPSEDDRNFLGAIEAAWDHGIRHFDTGARYGGGHSEELYGGFSGASGTKSISPRSPTPPR